MPILTVASSKGGSAKTTTTALLAARLAADGVSVAVVDADPNGSFARWADRYYDGPKIEVRAEADEGALARTIAHLAKEHLAVLVDTAGFASRSALLAIASADAVLIPVLPGEAEIHEAERTVQLVNDAATAARRPIPARVLVARTKRTTLARHALSELESARLPRLAASLGDRTAYASIFFGGPAVFSSGPEAEEIAALVAELRDLSWLPRPQRR
ncbi:AAA family ATPase [Belnapia rosea]|uniref:Chromosome partitioning protein n=1 Tax=Belnapia rosea TaxID=938405 RepID=A0A1G7BS81_9PROT|nr:AAA family ATPase [Belnapia rosea]SDE29968.1 chromosome partitioning protein [Belnapia rosea]